MTEWIIITALAFVGATALILAVDWALTWWDDWQHPTMCSPLHPCRECQPPPSNLDRLDGVGGGQ